MSTTDAIDLHVRTYRSALKSTLEVHVQSLTNSHLKMESILHPLGENTQILDVSALVYSLLRLPKEIDRTKKVIVGQNFNTFTQAGYRNVESWTKVSAPSRRRTCFHHHDSQLLAVFAASISDIDDLTNLLIAYQTEWNKCHTILHQHASTPAQFRKLLNSPDFHNSLGISDSDWYALSTALGRNWKLRFRRVYKRKINIKLRLLAGSWIDYTKTVQQWWRNIARAVKNDFYLGNQQIYFVSSNTHSLLNIITGFPLKLKKFLISAIKTDHPSLYHVWQQIRSGEVFINEADFLYFISRYYQDKLQQDPDYQKIQDKLNLSIIPTTGYLDTDVQIFPVKNLVDSKYLDPRIKITKPKKLSQSQALIFNINYPLGFAAYHILSEVMENITRLKGLYILGKAAVLNGEIGDIQIPRLVFDEHTQNSYIFKNCFNSFFPFTNHQGSILTNQKSVTVLGTFLENEALIDTYSRNNLTVIEMESGPFLNAVTESTYDQQTPRETIIDLNNAPFDIGIINYTSDTPYSKAKNLGSHRLTLNGVEPVYLGSLAILQRIINLEENPHL